MTMTHQLPQIVLDAFESWSVLAESGERLPLDSNVSLVEALALHRAVKENHCQSTAEVGLAKGISATAIVSAIAGHPGAMHDVMDPYQTKYGNAGLRMLRDSGLSPHFRHYSQYAEEVFPSLPALDFVFIDASHLFDYTMVEFILADKKLKVGGMIAFHDLWMPSLRKLLRYILRNRDYAIERTYSDQARGEVSSKRLTTRQRLHNVASALGRTMPKSDAWLSDELRYPWHQFGLNNMVFIKKQSNDSRDWRHFRPF
jgi:hypothetical protein